MERKVSNSGFVEMPIFISREGGIERYQFVANGKAMTGVYDPSKQKRGIFYEELTRRIGEKARTHILSSGSCHGIGTYNGCFLDTNTGLSHKSEEVDSDNLEVFRNKLAIVIQREMDGVAITMPSHISN